MNLEALLSDRLAAALQAVAGRRADPAVRRSQHADFQSGAALPLARELGRPPRAIASEVLAAADLDGIAVGEVSGPGFLNLTIAEGLLASAAGDPRLEPTT
jgi:arginyl-tRNA synthetase